MLSRIAQTAARRSSNSILAAASSSSLRASPIALSNTLNQIDVSKRNFSVLKDNVEASEAWKQSCYMAMDFTIPEDASVYEAVQRFSAFNIGCLVTTDADGEFFFMHSTCFQMYLFLHTNRFIAIIQTIKTHLFLILSSSDHQHRKHIRCYQ